MISVAVQKAQNKLMETGLASPGQFHGCTEDEILSIEDRFQVQLPICYRDFLSVMGRCAGAFLLGNDYSFPKMFRFRKGVEALLEEYKPDFKLPPTAFVFLSLQGCSYSWFLCKERADDPPVYLFNEEDSEPHMVEDSFSAWLINAVDYAIAAYQELDSEEEMNN